MHILGVKTEDSWQKMAVFLVIESIKYANLKSEKFNTWNVKVECKSGILDRLRNF